MTRGQTRQQSGRVKKTAHQAEHKQRNMLVRSSTLVATYCERRNTQLFIYQCRVVTWQTVFRSQLMYFCSVMQKKLKVAKRRVSV